MKKKSFKCSRCGVKVKKKFKNYKEKQEYEEVNNIHKGTVLEDKFCKKCATIIVKEYLQSLQ